mgnify:FL=1
MQRITFIVGLMAATTTFAQPSRNGTLPLQGKLLPSVTAFDEDGQEFSLTKLKGEYSVLVFGCLT